MSRRLLIIICIAFFVILGAWLFIAKKSSSKKPNILVVMVDTLRADHLGVYGYSRDTSPFIDELAKESLVFDRAIATSSWTAPSVASVMTGLYPSEHRVMPNRHRTKALKLGHKIPAEIKLLAENLKQEGYWSAGVSANAWISKNFGFDRGFDAFYSKSQILANEVVEVGRKMVERHQAEAKDAPMFLYLHFMDPHTPYKPPKIHQQTATAKPYPRPVYGDRKERTMVSINRYDGEIRFVDEELRAFFGYLKEKGLEEDLKVIFTSDHGEQFHEHGRAGHGFELHVEEIRVPLIVRNGSRPTVIKEVVSNIDIKPTVLAMAGSLLPNKTPGVSLLDLEAVKARKGVYSEVYRVLGQRSFSALDGLRLLVNVDEAGTPEEQLRVKGLYDLNTDPTEFKAIEDPGVSADLMESLKASHHDSQSKAAAEEEVAISEDDFEQLKTLGYINN